jgi:hypothetical protein
MTGKLVLQLLILMIGTLVLFYVAAPMLWQCFGGATCQ